MKRRLISLFALAVGAACLSYAAYIPAKAWVAQVLLERAWSASRLRGYPVQPWPWADTTAVARLQAPSLGIDQIVLAGASGRVLAFGPGHVTGSARPGELGNIVFSGHRDTHFRWLASLAVDDPLAVESAQGVRHYRVADVSIHHETETALLDPLSGDQLRLLTCYPFDAIAPGTDQRFVVTAIPDVPRRL